MKLPLCEWDCELYIGSESVCEGEMAMETMNKSVCFSLVDVALKW